MGACSAASDATRQRDRWTHQLEAQGVNVRGDSSPEQLAMLGAHWQRAEAYAAAAVRATPGGGDRLTPVVLGSSIREARGARRGGDIAWRAGETADVFDGADSEQDGRFRSASTFPDHERVAGGRVNCGPAASRVARGVPELAVVIPDGRLHAGGREAHRVGWFAEMQRYEENGKRKDGSGLRRLDDLVLDDEFV